MNPTTNSCSRARLAATTQEDAREHRAELPGNAVHEGQDLASSASRQDAEEGSEGGVGDAALHDLLTEAHEQGGRGREAHDPEPETREVDERQGQRHRRDAEARIEAIGQQRADEEGSDGDRGVEERQDREQLRLIGVGSLHGREERELEAEEQDGQEHVGDGHEAHQRGGGHVSGAGGEGGQ